MRKDDTSDEPTNQAGHHCTEMGNKVTTLKVKNVFQFFCMFHCLICVHVFMMGEPSLRSGVLQGMDVGCGHAIHTTTLVKQLLMWVHPYMVHHSISGV